MYKKEINISDKNLIIETGKMAKQANGAVTVTYGDTIVLVTATSNMNQSTDLGYFPLSVDYREKMYAAGKIPGGFFKREGRPSEDEIIASRLTDRPIRPLFPDGFMCEVQILINVLSYDGEHDPDILGSIGASAALTISDIPWNGPIASVRVGKIEDKFIINPTKEQSEISDMEIIVSGTKDSIVMVEGEANFISEDTFLSGIQYAHEAIKDIIKVQIELAEECGKEKKEFIPTELDSKLNDTVLNLIEGNISSLNDPKMKDERYQDIQEFTDSIVDNLIEEYPDDEKTIRNIINEKVSIDLRTKTINGVRADGRGHSDIRDISIQTEVLPRTHGSALFTRGETQALVVTTLGGKRDEQMLDNIDGLSYKNYMLHYNFPPFSVGEVRKFMGLSRREVGHGNLAERALKRVIPTQEEFPYTYRIVSDILESNGSSSMATVCGATMSLMDAGVPITTPVAGIAMGLIMEDEDNYAILSDILGTEDHLGDMDFKVTGSDKGITAIQMDLKIDGLPIPIMKKALQQAKDGRLHILQKMNDELSSPRKQLSKFAPKIIQSELPVDRIGDFIGPGGKNIKKLIEDYECQINVDDDGRVIIMGIDSEPMEKVKSIVEKYNLVPEPGESYDATVVKIMDFGAFVSIAPGHEGLVHISELAWEHVGKVEDVVKVGDEVKVKLQEIDNMKRLNFSIKALLPKPDNYKGNNNKSFNSGNKHKKRSKGFQKQRT